MISIKEIKKPLEQQKEKVDKEKVKRAKEILEEVKNELIRKIEKRKLSEEEIEKLLKVFEIDYMKNATGSKNNLKRALENSDSRKKIIKFISKVKKAQNSDEAYTASKELKENTKNVDATVATILGHILKPNWFIPLLDEIMKTIFPDTPERKEARKNFINLLKEFKTDKPEEGIKVCYALYNLSTKKDKEKIVNNFTEKKKNEKNEYFKKIEKILTRKGQIILYGVPGTGKTWLARNYVEERIGNDKNKYAFITFHQSYSYEDFIEGFRPKVKDNENGGNIIYEVEDGIFKKKCIEAIWEALKEKNKDNKNLNYTQIKQKVIDAIKNKRLTKEDFKNVPAYYLIIDEINRGNISNILGELITLLEMDKRLGEENEIITTLPYSREPFAVPSNLYIIGTMNTADRSIALLDVALRRRFGFIEIEPEEELLTKDKLLENWRKICSDKEYQEFEKKLNELFKNLGSPEFLKNFLETINKQIVKLKGKDYRIGHSYFLKVKELKDLKYVWFYEIIPLLEEYFYEDWESLKKILQDFVKKEEVDDKPIYKIKRYEDFNEDSFIKDLKSIIEKGKNNQQQDSQNIENQNG